MSTSTKSILAAVVLSLTFALTGCGGGSTTADNQTPQTPGTTTVPPGADPLTWKPTATITFMSLAKTTYAAATPAPVVINYHVSLETTPQNGSAVLHAGLSNSTIIPGICEPAPVTAQYQDLGATLGSNMLALPTYKITKQVGVYTTSPSSGNLIMPTPINGIDYTQPTFIILTLCVPDMS